MQALPGIRTLNTVTLREVWCGRSGGHPVDTEHAPHLDAAIGWLTRAQDATATGGIARGYSLVWNPYFGGRGWEPAYPETTGYIIPTLLTCAHDLRRVDLRARAMRAAEWECDVQMPSGAVQGGVIGQEVAPAIFNTGQVIFGWLAAYERTGTSAFRARRRACGDSISCHASIATASGAAIIHRMRGRKMHRTERHSTTREPRGRLPKLAHASEIALRSTPPRSACGRSRSASIRVPGFRNAA